VLAEVARWGKDVKAYAELRQRELDPAAAANVYASSANTQFTVAEQYEISKQLRAIRESLKQNFKLSTEQAKRVEDRLNEAEEASRRLGRKDWILLFSGAVFSLILTDVITPDVAQHIFMVLTHGVSHLFVSEGGHGLGTLG
jgi:hypothetical protein